MTLLENSEPSVVPRLSNLSNWDADIKTKSRSKSDHRGTVPQSIRNTPTSSKKDSTARHYRRHKQTKTRNQNASSDKLATEALNESGYYITSSTMPLENSEPSEVTDFITVTHCPDPSDVQQSYDFEASNESSCPESEHIAVESSHDGARFLSRNATDDQGLVVATLIESDHDIFRTNIIVDAIVVEDSPDDKSPTPWYVDRRTLIFGIIVIAAVAISGAIASSNNNDEELVAQSVAPSPSNSYTSTMTPSLNIPTYLSSLEVLKKLYDSTNGSSWFNTWNFTSDQSYCTYYGIECGDESEQIVRIMLQSNNLRGSLPSELGMLSSLHYFDFDRNDITGTIPSELGVLSSLIWFDISINSITSTIPSELGMLSPLTWFNLYSNWTLPPLSTFSGTIVVMGEKCVFESPSSRLKLDDISAQVRSSQAGSYKM